MFSDPQSITVSGTAHSLPKVETGTRNGKYRKADGTFQLSISHKPDAKRVRSMYRVDQTAIVTDPITSLNDSDFVGLYIVIDRPIFGFTEAQIEALRAGFVANLTTATFSKLFAQES